MSKRTKKAPLNERLKAARKERHLRQVDVADLLKVTQNTVARWERGELGFHPAVRERVEAWIRYWKGEK